MDIVKNCQPANDPVVYAGGLKSATRSLADLRELFQLTIVGLEEQYSHSSAFRASFAVLQ